MSLQKLYFAINTVKVGLKLLWQAVSFPFIWIWRFLSRHHEALGVLLAFVATAAAIWAVKTQNDVTRELATQQNFFQFYEQWESEGMQERRARLAAELL